MLTSKRKQWILQMIKGPDLIPANSLPGHYSSKSTITLNLDNRPVVIHPVDVLDLSNAQHLIVQSDSRSLFIPWDEILSLEFEEAPVRIATSPEPVKAVKPGMVRLSVDKKAV